MMDQSATVSVSSLNDGLYLISIIDTANGQSFNGKFIRRK